MRLRIVNESVGNRARLRHGRTFVATEPAGVREFLLLKRYVATLVFCRKAKHKLSRERPALTAIVTHILDTNASLLHHLTSHSLLGSLASLHKSGNTSVYVLIALNMTCKENLVVTMDDDDNARLNARENEIAAVRAFTSGKIGAFSKLSATTSAVFSVASPFEKSLGTSDRKTALETIVGKSLSDWYHLIFRRKFCSIGKSDHRNVGRHLDKLVSYFAC